MQIFSIRQLYKFIIGIAVLILSFFAAMTFGAAETTFKQAWVSMTTGSLDSTTTMLREIRLPREIAAALVGAALAVSGAIMQGLTRNPLADPGLLGLTAGANAALAVTLAFFPSANYMGIMLACFIGAAVGVVLVFGIGSAKRGGFSPFRIVLAGAAISAFLFAVAEGISLYFKVSKDVSMWTAGGLIGVSWNQIQLIAPVVLIGTIVAVLLARQLTIISLNEDVAVGLGQNILLVKIILFIVITLLAGAAVALVGNLAFVGLMVPHMVRPFVGNDYRMVLPMSALFGGAFLLLADTLARTINAPYETPVAAIVAVLGLPFFLFVVQRKGNAFS
ncbi:iron chelate uptake ABC transporter family permease subunit [Halobacillus litoralis]|uniref:Iron chelate uptake ABC transporter family permease subunit n=1 Tax=Halobacillus litoralis TaxID=45668 RepID=A0A845DTA1_9BACI|nr:iron ABC transporter permease [Halobacillus litoralis]MCA1022835.1 iron ABC transporter permease [Halobacillus litoralis]MYL19582.1 iron chelate uptake ABC transporter family permease subunit [Halobacillus litoralis]